MIRTAGLELVRVNLEVFFYLVFIVGVCVNVSFWLIINGFESSVFVGFRFFFFI